MIDNIYLINLPERTDRLSDSIEEMRLWGMYYKTICAIKDKDGANGLKMTMGKLFESVLATKWERNVLVLEDDAKFLRPPAKLISEYVNQLPEDYHIAYLGCNMLIAPERVSENVLRIKAAYSSHAIIYSREAMRLILKHISKDKAYDQILQSEIQPLNKSYCIYPMLATQRDSRSDIADFDDYWSKPNLRKYLDEPTRTVKWDLMMRERFEQHTKGI